jgi:hypothetical protein
MALVVTEAVEGRVQLHGRGSEFCFKSEHAESPRRAAEGRDSGLTKTSSDHSDSCLLGMLSAFFTTVNPRRCRSVAIVALSSRAIFCSTFFGLQNHHFAKVTFWPSSNVWRLKKKKN